MQTTTIRHSVGPRQVGVVSVDREKIGLSDVAELAKRGIDLTGMIATMDAALNGARGSVTMGDAEYRKVFDSLQDLQTTASITGPIQFYQNLLPGIVRILTAPRTLDKLIGISTPAVGDFEDEEAVLTVQELTSKPQLYGDFTNVPKSSWNTNFERRTYVRHEAGAHVGILETARASKIRVDNAESQRTAAMLSLEIGRNQIGFYGFNSGTGRTYGFLNDPNLPAYQTVANGAAGTPQWSTKTAVEIIADILTMIAALRNQTQGLIDPKVVNTTLALSPAVVDRLSMTSTLLSNSVAGWLRENYPAMRIETAPQLTAANGGANVAYLYAEQFDDGQSTDNGRTFDQLVPFKVKMNGSEIRAKSIVESYSNMTAGTFCKRPLFVYRASGM